MSALRAEAVEVRRGGRAIVARAALTLEPGALVGLIGPNGAGKSTLLRVLAGLVAPTSGRVALAGLDVGKMAAGERSRLVAYVPQHFTPAWDYSVRDLLDLGSRRAERPPALAGLLRDHGLETLAARRWSQLSGGERARTLLASVLAAPCPVLLADEPGASLDMGHRLALLRRLKAEARHRTVVVVLHDLDLAARFCDRLVLMAAGEIVLDGAADAVIRDDALDRSFGLRFRRVAVADGALHLFPIEPSGPS
ncbi:ABC transporter ATP-binding protein [Chelatococcus reniformis]|uniref:ABC transporter n=1 Tax=Chelatococcus reniformis TaxID=1494448 RepID=A0A916XIT4_9HYPH|nr:ABC transporter ATP-binding protein [Chelatococcus reniformis]GGC74649.1 ABC transporter [Chelatococcus reniformis]